MTSFLLDDYDFDLPERLIAQEPAARRDASRLLVLDRARDAVSHERFTDLERHLEPGDLLVVNTTRVVPARVHGVRRDTGGRIELLFLAPDGAGAWEALVKTRGRLAEGCEVEAAGVRVRLRERRGRGRWSVEAPDDLLDRLDTAGVMPLPPYIKRSRDGDSRADLDRERYQTVYAGEPGAVAAPTAGLHFTRELLERLGALGVGRADVLLHVGLGTFQPVEAEDFREHRMHEERYTVPAETAAAVNETRARGRRVVAVGTTSVRSLESAWDGERVVPGSGRTSIFIHPPKRVRGADALLTNFHLPKSTLLLLVAALVGRERILSVYREAVRREYRFFSYGDAMLIL